MQIEQIKLKDFRNYGELTLMPHPGVNILFGQNGSGKTNLLEAVHYCALGRSHRTSQDREVVRRDCSMAMASVRLLSGGVRSDVAVRLSPGEFRHKTIFLDGKRAGKLSELMGRVRCVIFSPEDLLLIREGPSVRRRFLDMMLSQLSTAYFVALQQYQRALEQRNALLRNARHGVSLNEALMAAFEEAMATHCQVIIPTRRKVVAMIGNYAGEKYRSICGRETEAFSMCYSCCLPDDVDIAEHIARQMRENRQEDLRHGTTGFGIHREDLSLMLSGREMKKFASQGQIRTAALSIKLAQLEMYQRITGETPVLLLDDVLSELDMSRRTRLLQEIQGAQTFITCTDETDLEGFHEERSYRVHVDEKGLAMVAEISAGEKIERKIPWNDELE